MKDYFRGKTADRLFKELVGERKAGVDLKDDDFFSALEKKLNGEELTKEETDKCLEWLDDFQSALKKDGKAK